MTDNNPDTVYLSAYSAPDFLIQHTYLNFNLKDDDTTVTTILKVERNAKAVSLTPDLVLHGEDLVLTQIAIDGCILAEDGYTINADSLAIHQVPDRFTLEFKVKIDPENNRSLMGLYRSSGNYCTQCEAEGFRRITYFLDRPDVLSYFTVTIEADKDRYPCLLSNGNLVDKKDLGNNRHWVKWEDPSLKPCYLFALVAGDFDLLQDDFKTMSGRDVVLQIYVEKGFIDQADYAMKALQRSMKWDEEVWGREYDLDIYMIVAVSDFNMGAMENKGLNIFNTKYVLAKPETATDSDYVGIEAVIGHEYFHNWSGNRITCRDWFQITLKEGLTVFRDQEFTSDMTSAAVSRLDAVDVVKNRQFREDSGPLSHPIRPESYIEINNFYTLTVYRKGAEVVRMVQTLLTPEIFRQGLDLYFEQYDGQAVTTDDFIAAMQQVSNVDLSQFKHWYTQAGTPQLTISGDYDAAEQTFTLTVAQAVVQHAPSEKIHPFKLPLAIGLLNQSGSVIPMQLHTESESQTTTKVLLVDKLTQSFKFIHIHDKPIPSLLRGFSAPVRINYQYSQQDLALIWQYDSDPYCRWDAGQELLATTIIDLAQQLQSNQSPLLPSVIKESFEKILLSGPDDLAFKSRLLQFPVDSYIHQKLEQIDVHAIYQAKKYLMTQLAEELITHWFSAYKDAAPSGDYVYNQKESGRRSYQQLCLSYLVASGRQEYLELAYKQSVSANNMTDVMAALLALNHCDCIERQQALSEFYRRWSDEPLVVNKWLQLQASSSIPNTYDRVLDLLQHEAFDIHNPNNVYALLCSFAENHIHFHSIGGAGYEFIADQVLAIQACNPQVAVRVLQPLAHWRSFGSKEGQLMRQQLQRIAQQPGLSTDVYEVVNKSLT